MALIRRSEADAPTSHLARQAWDPFEMMQQMLRWDPFTDTGRLGLGLGRGAFTPAFEVRETKDAFVFKADMPGMKEEDLDVSVTQNRVTVSGQREVERGDEGDSWYTSERTYGAFTRTFTLPDGADSEHADADLKAGVLTIVVPKRAESKPRRLSLKGLLGKAEEKKA